MKSTSKTILTAAFATVFFLASQMLFAQPADLSVDRILDSYATDYEHDPMFTRDVTFGVQVDDNWWHIQCIAPSDSTDASAKVFSGQPESPTFYFKTDLSTLEKIDRGELNPLTGAAKAFHHETAPFDADVMEGFVPDGEFMPTLFSVFFHFWTRGRPEIIPFGIDKTRETHGAQACIFYYQPGFRSAYVAIKKGQHANQDKNSKTNPFPTLVIAIKGEGKTLINGVEGTLSEGQAVLIPANIPHEFMNPDQDEPLECILLMFGEGA